jgi:riboflavin synthase
MFTGLIETTGTVLALKTTPGGVKRLIIAAPELAGRWKIGDSIAVNGVCLTAVDMEETYEAHPGRFAADLAEETIQRTTLTSLAAGSLVNLELPTPAGSPMGGHVVQGHVDGTGKITSLVALHPDHERTDWRLCIALEPYLMAQVVPQGSITVDGISLTVAKAGDREIEIAVIPHTYKSTNLRTLLSGTRVNIETDVLSKYAAKRARMEVVKVPITAMYDDETPLAHLPAPPAEPVAAQEWLTVDYLISNGY